MKNYLIIFSDSFVFASSLSLDLLEKFQTIGKFAVSILSQIFTTNEISNWF